MRNNDACCKRECFAEPLLLIEENDPPALPRLTLVLTFCNDVIQRSPIPRPCGAARLVQRSALAVLPVTLLLTVTAGQDALIQRYVPWGSVVLVPQQPLDRPATPLSSGCAEARSDEAFRLARLRHSRHVFWSTRAFVCTLMGLQRPEPGTTTPTPRVQRAALQFPGSDIDGACGRWPCRL